MVLKLGNKKELTYIGVLKFSADSGFSFEFLEIWKEVEQRFELIKVERTGWKKFVHKTITGICGVQNLEFMGTQFQLWYYHRRM